MGRARYNANEKDSLLANKTQEYSRKGMSLAKANEQAQKWYYHSYVDPMTVPDELYYVKYGKYKPYVAPKGQTSFVSSERASPVSSGSKKKPFSFKLPEFKLPEFKLSEKRIASEGDYASDRSPSIRQPQSASRISRGKKSIFSNKKYYGVILIGIIAGVYFMTARKKGR